MFTATLDAIRAIPHVELILLGGSGAIALLMVIVGIATSAPDKTAH